jgi:general secretion pathway protein D
LLVFIRPTILRTTEDARAIAARRYGYIRDQQLLRDPDAEPSIDELVRDYLGTTPLIADEAVLQGAQIIIPGQTSNRPLPGAAEPIDIPASDGQSGGQSGGLSGGGGQ